MTSWPLTALAAWIWPFAAGGMLLWGMAALIPILIHLWSRRRYRESPWAAMTFLQAALRRHARRIRFEQYLLLALRALVLILLALALADPILPWQEAGLGAVSSDGATHVIVVVDVSYSMSARDGEISRLERARDWAATLVRQSAQGDGFSLVLMADAPRITIREPSHDRTSVLDELQALQTLHGGADLRAAAAEVESLVQDSERRFPRFQRRKVYFISDLGRTTWDAIADEGLRGSLERLASRAPLAVVDVGADATDNAVVTDLTVRDTLLTPGRTVRVEAEVANLGGRAVTAGRVEFELDGKPLATQTVDVPPAGRASVYATARLDAPGEHVVSVKLADDRLPLDNRRWLALPVRQQVRVLCVEGRLGEARYLALALEPTHLQPAPVAVETASESALLDRTLSEFDLVCLCNISRVTADEARALHAFVVAGGRLATFLGDQVQSDNYNEYLASGPMRVLPARLEQAAPTAVYALDPRSYQDSLVAPFRGQEQAGLLSTPIWKYVMATPVDARTSRVALAIDKGRPLVARERIGRGESILVTTAVSTASLDRSTTPPTPWTAWPTWPSFVPFIQELMRTAAGGVLEQRNVLVGQSIGGQLTDVPFDIGLSIMPPAVGDTASPSTQKLSFQSTGGGVAWTFDETVHAGIYRLRIGSPGDDEHLFVANLDTRESDLARFEAAQLPSVMQRESLAGDETASSGSAPVTRRSLFRYVLGALLVLLLVESAVAWRLGRSAEAHGVGKR